MLGTLESLKRKEEIKQKMKVNLSGRMIEREEIIQEDTYDSEKETDIESEFIDNTFYYFDNDLLSKSFQLATENVEEYVIHFCIYQLNMDKVMPYLKYVLKNEDGVFKFPNIYFTYSEADDVEVYFKNEVIKNLVSMLNFYDKIDGKFVSKVYKGFIEENENIYVFIDITEYEFYLNDNYKFVIMDEIINRRKVNDEIIDKIVSELFYNNKYLIYLKYSKTNKNIAYPLLGYQCSWDEKEQQYKNIYENKNTNEIDEEYYKIDHYVFGNNFYLSSEEINKQMTIFNFRDEKTTENKKLKRYAFFIEDTKYILKDIAENANIIQTELNDNLDSYTSIYFQENSIQLWCIKDVYYIAII